MGCLSTGPSCYLIPLHKNETVAAAHRITLRASMALFEERTLLCGDGKEVNQFPHGCGHGPFVHVSPISVTLDMSAWVERGQAADENDTRGIDKEPFPLGYAISAFLGLHRTLIQRQNAESPNVWLAAADPERLPALFWACLQTGFRPFAFLKESKESPREMTAKQLDLYSYFYSAEVSSFFSAPQMPSFTHNRLLHLMVCACLHEPSVVPKDFMVTHTRDFQLRVVVNPMTGATFSTPQARQARNDAFDAQLVGHGVTALKIKALDPYAEEDAIEFGAFLVPMGKYMSGDAEHEVRSSFRLSVSFYRSVMSGRPDITPGLFIDL